MTRNEQYALTALGILGGLLIARKVSNVAGPIDIPIYGPELELPPVDAYAKQDTTNTFDPTPKPGAIAFRQWAIGRFGERPGSPQNIGRWDKVESPSEHHAGRAWDLMTNSKEHGDQIVANMLEADPITGEPDALARRAGVMYMIWNKRIWRAYPYQGKPSGTWSGYTGPNPHTDHVHFSFSWDGANKKTSLYQIIDSGAMVA